ncbi:hypothetical protein [Psychrobacter sp. W2-37-MNA-CIBAN-0211]|uniref:hypothetical protein n=1 Tax=Psychrobacter sp. W2-37-MNA-CIBAN-0211 TaxID=3140443 RepID=UPI0033299715
MSQPQDPALIALQRQIQEKQVSDPYIAAKIAAGAIVERILSTMSDDKGVHVESAFAALGSLAGYACQQRALKEMKNNKSTGGEDAIITISDEQGNNYYYGNGINQPLLEDKLSVWSLVGGAVQSHGGTLPDVNAIVEHTTASIGTPEFGQPRLPEGHPIRYTLMQCLELWQPLKTEILDNLPVPAGDWGMAYALAIQSLMDQAKEVLSPSIAGLIVMECAIPMSKVKL